MRKIIILLVGIATLASCEKKQNPFEWNKNRVGYLTDSTMVYQLDKLYANDSIVKPIKGDEFSNGPADIEIYDKQGNHLLSLTPVEEDSTSTIEYVNIHDARYTTAQGITAKSTFKKISDTYKISSIDNMIMDAVIRVNEQNFYFTIDKEQLPDDVEFNMNATIEKSMIPDDAKPTSMLVTW